MSTLASSNGRQLRIPDPASSPPDDDHVLTLDRDIHEALSVGVRAAHDVLLAELSEILRTGIESIRAECREQIAELMGQVRGLTELCSQLTVTVPPNSINVQLPPRTVQKSISYNNHGQPVSILEVERELKSTPTPATEKPTDDEQQ